MFKLIKPELDEINKFLAKSSVSGLNYPEHGSTKFDVSPKNYTSDHNKISLGFGSETFDIAKAALTKWKMFDLSWVDLYSDETPIIAGKNVAVVIRHLGFYSINNARIIYVIDEPQRFGFAYGTLDEHSEIGEERFMVELDDINKEVIYSLYALSRPGHILAKLGYPYVRNLQKQFARDSMAAMKDFVNNSIPRSLS